MQSLIVQICNSGNYHIWRIYEIMVDNIKLITLCRNITNRLYEHPDFEECKSQNRYYYSLYHKKYKNKLRFDFRKSIKDSKLIGFRHVEITISPHYHHNEYRHNADDFTFYDCVKTIKGILPYLEIKPDEYDLLKVVNIEFGVNLLLNIPIEPVINGLIFHKKTKYIIPYKNKPFYKLTGNNSCRYKQLKAYAKGIHANEVLNISEISRNTFRFEIKSKESKKIKKLGIHYANDFLDINNYKNLIQELINEWEHVLLLNLEPDFNGLNPSEIQFLKEANTIEFWENLKNEKNRNKFGRYKAKYYKILKGKNNLHHQIKLQIIDKLVYLQSGANSII